jgi:hypothetical protein
LRLEIIGGTDNFTADREAAGQILAAVPDGRAVAQANRDFVQRAVHLMAASGIAQFIDLGAGIPRGPGIHDVARSVLPAARVVYVDADPVACTHWQALLGTEDGAAVVMADIRDPGAILAHPELNRLISFTRPVGVLLTAVLPFIGDADADASVAAFRQRMCPGSMLAISHVTSDGTPPEVISGLRDAYSLTGVRIAFRAQAGIETFFGGFKLARPGIVDIAEWPDPRGVLVSAALRTAAGVAQVQA